MDAKIETHMIPFSPIMWLTTGRTKIYNFSNIVTKYNNNQPDTNDKHLQIYGSYLIEVVEDF